MGMPNYFDLQCVQFAMQCGQSAALLPKSVSDRLGITDEELQHVQFVRTGKVPEFFDGGNATLRKMFAEMLRTSSAPAKFSVDNVAFTIQSDLFDMQFRRAAYHARVEAIRADPQTQKALSAPVSNVREICADLIAEASTGTLGHHCDSGEGQSFAVGVNAGPNENEVFLRQQLEIANLLIDELKARLKAA